MTEPGGSPPRDARSRDPSGRPRNARPRDRLGRPLPPGSAGVEPVPDDLDLAPPEALDLAQRLLDEGRPFSAHEVLEAVWKSAPHPERELWRGLAQLAVGRTHLERGNPRGARALLRRGGRALEAYRGSAPYGVAVDRLIEESGALADWVSVSPPEGAIPPMVLRDPPPSSHHTDGTDE